MRQITGVSHGIVHGSRAIETHRKAAVMCARQPSIGAAFEALILVLESPRWIIRTSGMTSSPALFADCGLSSYRATSCPELGVRWQQSVRQALVIRSAVAGRTACARKRAAPLRAFLQTESGSAGILLRAIVVALI